MVNDATTIATPDNYRDLVPELAAYLHDSVIAKTSSSSIRLFRVVVPSSKKTST